MPGGIFTIGDGPHGAFECNENNGTAIYGWGNGGWDNGTGEVARRVPLAFQSYGPVQELGGLVGWIYRETHANGRYWFFSGTDNSVGLRDQYYRTDGPPWVGPFTVSAVPIPPDYGQ